MNNKICKLISVLFLLSYLSYTSWAQAPQAFKYQAVARDANTNVLASSSLSVRVGIHDQTSSGTLVYQETFSVSTNAFGLFNIEIGTGTAISGAFTSIDWATNDKYMEIEIDFGNGYVSMGTSQLLSVPYALHAANGLASGSASGNTMYWNGSNWVTNSSNIYNGGSNVGIGTTSPVQKLDVNGSINIETDSCYKIGNYNVLSVKGSNNLFIGYSGIKNSSGVGNSFIGELSGIENTSGDQNSFLGAESGASNTSGKYNSFVGYGAGNQNKNGNCNSFFGNEAGYWNTGSFNSFIGVYSGFANSTGYNNSFLGYKSGYSNTTGGYNVFMGNQSGYSNTTGYQNIFIGNLSGYSNITGSTNSFLGHQSGYSNTTGSNNSFVGFRSGYLNTTGNNNSFLGYYSGYSNTTGRSNSFLGYYSGYQNTTGSNNIFIGKEASRQNTTGSKNVVVGDSAGYSNTTGGNNTYIGYKANGSSTLSNAMAIGNEASVTASNKVVVGNTSVTSIGGQVGWSTFSDARLKTNVQKSELGLEFILKLNPVTYNYKVDGQKDILYSGFIAQEVEATLRELGTEFSAVDKPKNDEDYYSIRYAEFVVPLVKAMQEQQQKIEELEAIIKEITKK